MAPKKIPSGSTLTNLTGTPARRTEYVRNVLANFHALGPGHASFVVRIGVAGTGHSPHYKFEAAVPVTMNGEPIGVSQDTFEIYHGANHKKMTAFDLEHIRDEHWSTKTMTFAEVQAHLGELRAHRKA